MHITVAANIFSERYYAKIFWIFQYKLDTHSFIKAGPSVQVFNWVQFRNEFEIRFVEKRVHVKSWLPPGIAWDWRGKFESISRNSLSTIFQDKQWIRLKKFGKWCELTIICPMLKSLKRLHTKALRARVNKREQKNKRQQTSEKYWAATIK